MASDSIRNNVPQRGSVTDEKICETLGRHDQRGMELLYDAYYRQMVLWANTFLDDLHAAEDLVQELFVDVWTRKLYTGFRCGAIGSYLRVMVRNRCLNHRNRRGLVYSAFEIDKVERALDSYNDSHDRLYGALIEEMERLHPRSRQVFRAVCIDGMKYREVARRYDISVSTVKTLMSRTLDSLRKKLGEFKSLII